MKSTLTTFLLISTLYAHAQDFVGGPYTAFSMSSPLVADFTGDGKPDVLGLQFGGSGLGKMALQVNTANPTIAFSEKSLNIDLQFAGAPAAADLDGDGGLDVVAAKGFDYDLFLLKNDGSGNFALDSLGVSGASFLKIADMDQDNDLDIVGMSLADRALIVFRNDGNLKYSAVPLLNNASNLEQLQVGDMDGDKVPDIVAGFYQFTGKQLVIYQNKGNFNFQPTTILSNDFYRVEGMRIEDINNDGKNDLLYISTFSCEGFINKGDVQFERKRLISGVGVIRSLTTGDFNGDGRKDIVLGKNSEKISWHPNLSTTTLEFGNQPVGSVSPAFTVVAGDLDGDKDLDLVVTNGAFWWYENVVSQSVATTVPEMEALQVSPNPFHTFLNINGLKHADYRIAIVHNSGATVYSAEGYSGRIDLSQIPAGGYFLQITDKISGQKQQLPLIKLQ